MRGDVTRTAWKSILISVVLGFAGSCIAQTKTVPEDREIGLVGILREVQGFGPPGYGEDKKSDSKIRYWALELPTPITTPCTPERPEWKSSDCASTKRLRIFFKESSNQSDLERKARAAGTQKMFVRGTLHRSDTAGEITPIYMDVTKIESAMK
jgi:hypothetical protein